MAEKKSIIINGDNLLVVFIRKYFKWLMLAVVAGGIFGFVLASFNKKQYSGGVRFVLEDGSGGGGLSSLIGMAAQFGLDFNMKGSSAVFSGDNVLELLKSRMLVEKTLLNKISINGKETTLAEEYVNIADLNKKNKLSQQIHFLPDISREKFTRQQDSVLMKIYDDIIKYRLNVVKPDKKLSFINVDMKFMDEKFVCVFTQSLVKEVTDFYVDTKTKLLTQNIKKLEIKSDSILRLLNATTYKIAQGLDLNINPVFKTQSVPMEISNRDKFVLQTLYGEIVKNLELAKITLSQETPLVQIIDKPIMPLKEEGRGRIKGAINWGLIIGLLAFVFLIIKSTFQKMQIKTKEIIA